MVILATAQSSGVNQWELGSVPTEAPTLHPTRINLPKIEKYDDPRRNYGFLVAVRIGNANQENWFHPSHSILDTLKKENFDLASLPTKAERAIHIDNFHFHKIPNPVFDLHKIEPQKMLANEILNTLIRTINKMPLEEPYKFDLLKPVILNFSKTSDENGRNPKFKITYPGINGEVMHEIESNFGGADCYAYCDIGESLLDGWLENSANEIAKSLFA